VKSSRVNSGVLVRSVGLHEHVMSRFMFQYRQMDRTPIINERERVIMLIKNS